MKKLEWVEIENNGSLYTEILDLGFVCMMRVYGWDEVNDKVASLSVVEIDRVAGQLAIKAIKKATEKNNA